MDFVLFVYVLVIHKLFLKLDGKMQLYKGVLTYKHNRIQVNAVKNKSFGGHN